MVPRHMIAALCLGLAVPAVPALAQTVSAPAPVARPVLTNWAYASPSTSDVEPSTTAMNEGAYERLSVGNRKIARAIFEAQKTDGTSHLTLDDIAAMKRSGQGGWGRIYEDMYARRLVTEKNLGRAVSRYYRQQHVSHSGGSAGGHAESKEHEGPQEARDP